NFEIKPWIIANGSFNGRWSYEPLRPGYYLLRIVLGHVDENSGRLTYITHWEKPVKVEAETISTQVDFYMSDLRMMGARARILIEILPIDESQLVLRLDQKPD